MRKVTAMLTGLALALGVFLAGSAGLASGGSGPRHRSTAPEASCLAFLAARSYAFCEPQVFRGTATVWVRDASGAVTAVPGARWRSNPPYGP